MKKLLCFAMCAVLCGALFGGCFAEREPSPAKAVDAPGRYEETYYDLFDTECTFIAYTDTEEQFDELSEDLHDYLLTYHELYDIYKVYDGIVNLRTLNLSSGREPITVDDKILDLLEFGKQAYDLSGGKVNVAYGAVLSQWHTLQTAADEDDVHVLPNDGTLAALAAHADINDVILDRAHHTVFIRDTDTKVNVGAIAKGYAAQQACAFLRERGVTSAALNMGGTVCTIGKKQDDGAKWSVGIADPDGNGYLKAVEVADKCVVTSGDYERYFEVEGTRYCHLIDPATNYPARTFRSCTVIGDDAGLCDVLSTALFLLPLDEGQRLIKTTDNVEAFWILADGSFAQSDGFSALLADDEE